MMRAALFAIVLFVFIGLAASRANATTVKALGTFDNWKAFAAAEDKQPVCYMVLSTRLPAIPLKPVKVKGRIVRKTLGRSETHVTITHRPAEGSIDTVSYESGYTFRTASDATLHLGAASYNLFTNKASAWSRDQRTDHALAASIRKSPAMTVAGIPAQPGAGAVTDKIDLRGADAAYHAISKACGLEKPPLAKLPAKTHKSAKAKTTPKHKASAAH